MHPALQSLARTLPLTCLALSALAGAAPSKQTPGPAVASAPAAAVGAAARVANDFSGRWRLDLEHSDFGAPDRAKPRERVDTIAQQGADITLETVVLRQSGDTLRYSWRYATDGRAISNTMMGQEVKTVGRWDGGTLRFESTAQWMMIKYKLTEHWTLSPDHRQLTVERESAGGSGNSKQVMVFGKL